MKNKMMKSMGVISFVAILGALVSVAGAARQAEDPGVLLRAAIEKEEVDGDLQAAIGLYKQIVTKHSNNRPIAAKALIHLGGCYEKLGKEQAGLAQKAFETVVKDYPDQTEAVNLAKEKLSLLSRTPALKKTGSAEFSIRQVWAERGTDTSGSISPDGRYLTFVDWETGDLAMRDLVSGANRRLTNKGPWEQSPGEMAMASKWCRDSRQIVYQWYDKDGILELRVFDTKDSSIRTVHRDKTEDWVQAFDWSPDERYVLAGFFPRATATQGGETRVGLISVEDGSVKALKGRFEDSMDYASVFLFSPDGKYIAYDAIPASEETGSHDIFLISLDGQVEIPLVEHPEDDKLISWTPDGQGLLFTSDRTGSLDLWLLPMSDGKPQEAPMLVKSGFGPMGSLGMTSRGELYFGSGGGATRDIYVVDVEPGTWKARSPVKKLALPNQGRNLFANYSPDGQRMAFVSLLAGGRHPVLNILYEKTGRVRELNPRLEGIQFPCWIPPDGRDLSVGSYDKEGRIALYRVDAQTGEAALLVQFEKGQGSQAQAWSADGKRFFYTAEVKPEGKRYIYTYDLETGKNERLSGSPDDVRFIAVSPDGEWLAAINAEGKRTIKIMPASGGEPREVYRFAFESGTVITPAWSVDGRYIYFPWPQDPQTNIADLYRVSRDGGEAERIDVGMRFIRGLTVRPDGQRIAFYSSGDKPPQAQVWVMENFLPKAKLPAK